MTVSPSYDTASRAEVSRLHHEVTQLRRQVTQLERDQRQIHRVQESERFHRQLRTDVLMILVPGLILVAAVFLTVLDAKGRL